MAIILNKWRSDERDKKAVKLSTLEQIVNRESQGECKMVDLPEPENWRQTDSCLIVASGYWWLKSEKDKRWRAEGKSAEVGGTSMCIEAKRAFWELKKKYGPKVPGELRYAYEFDRAGLKKFKLAQEQKIK
jgi:hypothetical protein